MKRSRTPQEKKVLSYAKDRRNVVAESRAAARKSIAKRKAQANQSLRREVHARLGAVIGRADEAEVTDPFVARMGRTSWKKKPDVSLGNYLAMKIRHRPKRGMSSKAAPSELLAAGRSKASKRRGGR
jgi:hypothetical protein